MSYLDRVRAELALLDAAGRRRTVRPQLPPGALDFSSNDYLGLGRDARVLAALRACERAGSGGSRLLGGAHPEHAALEGALAEWTRRGAARVFSSGYLAALGAVTALAPCVAAAYSDELVHACIIDGLRLTKLERHIVPHARLPERADGRPALVVTESVFGMDGSRAPLAAMVAGLHDGDVLLIDEAHALGLTGAGGSGLAASFGDERVVVIGTLSKALGAAGGFVAGPPEVVELLANAARSFIFDTAPPPGIVAAAARALEVVRSREGDALRARVRSLAARVRDGLRAFGYDLPAGEGPAIAVVAGDETTALELARALEARGVYAPAIRPPTVPRGTCRIRLTVCAHHTDAQIDALLQAMRDVRTAACVSS